jgi:hypothetical protein
MCKILVIVAALLLSGCLDSEAVDAYYQKCMSLKPGVTLDTLRSQFGKEQFRKDDLVMFLPITDYSLLTSGEINAHLNPGTEVIEHLDCAEFKHAF